MKCHYEVLEVDRNADNSEIKSAYRKLALRWHPDKNLDNEQLAKEQFQLVQQAYEVLSDRQERAWYDAHREQILYGSNSEFEDNSLDVFQYFTSSCYSGFGDDEKGFYAVYRKVFDDLGKEDLEFIEDKEEFDDIPKFGDSGSNYEEVVASFYDYWGSYSTKKSYVWLDPCNIKELPNRRVAKLVEKENKKIRQKAKKERNEQIRNLVAFVKKRDKRVQEQAKLVKAKVIENRGKQEKISKQKRLQRSEELHTSQGEWTKFENVQSELEEIEKSLAEEFGEDLSSSNEEESEVELDSLYCAACNKLFKTPKAFENHESSKKHKENVAIITKLIREEDEQFNEAVLTAESSENESIAETCKKKSKKKIRKIIEVDSCSEPELNIEPAKDSDDEFKSAKKEKKKKKAKATNPVQTCTEEAAEKPPTLRPKKIKKVKEVRKSDCQEAVDPCRCCVMCKSMFDSKNKLFEHLKKTGHGVYLPTKCDKRKIKLEV